MGKDGGRGGRKGGEGGGQKEEDRIWNYLLYICSIICTFVALDEFFLMQF